MAGSSSVLEAAPIGKQIFAHGISQRDPTAFWLVLDTYATRLLAQALSQELLLPMVISDRLHCRSPRSSAFLACGGGYYVFMGSYTGIGASNPVFSTSDCVPAAVPHPEPPPQPRSPRPGPSAHSSPSPR